MIIWQWQTSPISSGPWYILFPLPRIPFTSFRSEFKYHLSSCCQSQTHLPLRYYWFTDFAWLLLSLNCNYLSKKKLSPLTQCLWDQRSTFLSKANTSPGVSIQWMFADWISESINRLLCFLVSASLSWDDISSFSIIISKLDVCWQQGTWNDLVWAFINHLSHVRFFIHFLMVANWLWYQVGNIDSFLHVNGEWFLS